MRRANEIPGDSIANQVRRVREIYSRIGEPLSVDTIIDLHRHLGPALKAAARSRRDKPLRRRGAQG